MNPLVFQTDFGLVDGAVSAMYGVAYSVNPALRIHDLTHDITPFHIWEASYRLIQTIHYWPENTVFVSVVDPGVGSDRRSVVARTKSGRYVVTPDNGALTHIKKEFGILEVREIDERVNRLPSTRGVSIFHGRDLFGYTAARLASGIIDFEGVGPAYPVEEIVCHPIPEPTVGPGHARGIFEIDDPNFGNLWTNIPLDAFNAAGFAYGDMVHTRVFHGEELIFEQDVLFHRSFGFAEKGAPMLYNNELMKLGMAVTQGSLERQYGMGFGSDWIVDLSKA